MNKLNKYLIDIVRSYLIISEYNVKRSKELVIYNFKWIIYEHKFYHLTTINEIIEQFLYIKYNRCLICDNCSYISVNHKYNPYIVPYYILKYYTPCNICRVYLSSYMRCLFELKLNNSFIEKMKMTISEYNVN